MYKNNDVLNQFRSFQCLLYAYSMLYLHHIQLYDRRSKESTSQLAEMEHRNVNFSSKSERSLRQRQRKRPRQREREKSKVIASYAVVLAELLPRLATISHRFTADSLNVTSSFGARAFPFERLTCVLSTFLHWPLIYHPKATFNPRCTL